MRVKLYALFTIVIIFNSCDLINDNNSPSEEYNIQNEFYSVPFGTSQKELTIQFNKFGFYSSYNDPTYARFISKEGLFDFGGFDWDEIRVWFAKKDQFHEIIFARAFNDKDSAIDFYEKLKTSLKNKYNIYQVEPAESSSKVFEMFCRESNDKTILVYYYDPNPSQKIIKYVVELQYRDLSIYKDPSDEL